MDKEEKRLLAAAIILAGMASNYSTTSPSIILARGYAKELLDSILDGKRL